LWWLVVLELGGMGLISDDVCCQKFGLLTNGLHFSNYCCNINCWRLYS
jgi:hypothetical protein